MTAEYLTAAAQEYRSCPYNYWQYAVNWLKDNDWLDHVYCALHEPPRSEHQFKLRRLAAECPIARTPRFEELVLRHEPRAHDQEHSRGDRACAADVPPKIGYETTFSKLLEAKWSGSKRT